MTTAELIDLYRSAGQQIFEHSCLIERVKYFYTADPLKTKLQQVLPSRKWTPWKTWKLSLQSGGPPANMYRDLTSGPSCRRSPIYSKRMTADGNDLGSQRMQECR
jgi:hypothetical protein